MTKITAFSIAAILVAGIVSTAKADFVYYDNGSVYELQPGESVYVSSGRIWEFTRFDPLDLRIQALEPLSTVDAEEGPEDTSDCLGFGPGGCAPSSDEPSESDIADLIERLAQNIANADG